MAVQLIQCLLIILIVGIEEKCHGIRLIEKGKLHHRVSRQTMPLIDVDTEGIGYPPIVGSKTNRLLSNVLKNNEGIMLGQPSVPNTNTNYNAVRNNAAGPNSEQSVVTLSTQIQGNLPTGGASLGGPTGGLNLGGVSGSPNPADTIIGQSPGGPVTGSNGIGGIPGGTVGALAASGEAQVSSPIGGALPAERFGGGGGALSAPSALGGSPSLTSRPSGTENSESAGINGLGGVPEAGNGGMDPAGELAGAGVLPPGGNPTVGLPPGGNPSGGLGGGSPAGLPPPPPPNNALNTGPASNTGSNANGVNGLTNANGGFGTNTGIGLNTVTVLNLSDKDGKNPYRDGINININPGVAVNEEGKLVSSQASIEASSLIGLGVKAAASALSYNVPDPHESSIAHDLKQITHILSHDKLKQYDELSAKKAHLIDAIEKETEKISSHHGDPHANKPHYEDLHHKEAHLREEIKKETEKIEAHHVDPHHIDPHQIDPHHIDPHQIDPYQIDPHHIDPHQIDPYQIDPHHIDPHHIDPHQIDPYQIDPHYVDSHHKEFLRPYQMYPHGEDMFQKKEHQIESIKDNMHHIDPFQIDPHHVVYYNPYIHGPQDAYEQYYYEPHGDFYDRRYSHIEDQIPQLQEIDRLTRLLDSLRGLDPYQPHYKREVFPLYVQEKEEECVQ